MKAGVLVAVVMLLLVVHGRSTFDSEICPGDLAQEIELILSNCSCDSTYWGIKVDQYIPHSGWTTLYALNDKSYFVPASNNKLLTTTTAFYELGTDFSVTTPLYMSVEGDLCLYGQGDPTLAYNDLLNMGLTLKEKGITKVRNIYVDETYYEGSFLPENWEWSDLIQQWGALPSPLIVDENVIVFNVYSTKTGQLVTANFSYEADEKMLELIVTATTSDGHVVSTIGVDVDPRNISKVYVDGSIPTGSGQWPVFLAAIDTGNRFAALLAECIAGRGISIQGTASVSSCSQQIKNANWKLVASVTSPNLTYMMNHTLQESDNLFAETFLLHLGKTRPANETDTTQMVGLQVAQEFITSTYGANMTFYQDDGSGLSRHNLVTPATLTNLISNIYFGKGGQTYLSFLPVAGLSGTLVDRFIGTPAQGVLHAKTGTLDGVNTLTGFIDHHNADMPLLAFSIMANNANTESVPVIDEIGVILALLRNC